MVFFLIWNQRIPVGASLLAMDVNDDACYLNKRVVLTFFASKLAPTGIASLRPCYSIEPGT
ncbi:hypothetical protein PMA3_25155 [Pseudomonas silesiensis]|uniref:Uncharacterized protein n=1 Tax=Pseudomonas silesiensis TaxID=1853130 RepID=A0A191YZW7_9PSED|nr:hypothetical protein PMA3_25155 [Pseudomonas silesiensis]